VYDYFITSDPASGENVSILVMDLIDGEDLEQMLQNIGGPLPDGKVIIWLDQVCGALEYLHQQNPPVIHRDIKPANIKITPSGNAMLVDFGIAKLYDAQARTTVGARAYTPGYSPPEQYGQGATDAQSDVYALGATAYQLLTGVMPPDSMDIVSGLAAPLLPARQINPIVSVQTSLAIQRALEIHRSKRWVNVEAFRSALRPAQQARPIPIQSTGKIASTVFVQPAQMQASQAFVAEPKWQKTRLPWAWIAAAMGLGLVTILALGALVG
jgi:serine/threonine protein kinase